MPGVRCPSCTNNGTLKCTRCQDVLYCSAECQRADWQFHKTLCKTFADFEKRPENMRRVIRFDPEKNKPEFDWLPIFRIEDDSELPTTEEVDYRKIIDEGEPTSDYITSNPLLERALGYQINFAYDDGYTMRYSTPNKAVLGATNGKARHDWRGPLVAFCGDASVVDGISIMTKARDMDLKAFSDLVAWLLWYPSQRRPMHTDPLLAGFESISLSKIKGVRANCPAEVRANNRPYVESVELPTGHPIFGAATVSPISQRIGMPLAFYKIPEKLKQKYAHLHGSNFDNYNMTMMMLACDASKDTFGWAPAEWQGGQIPNVLVARTDGTPFDPEVYGIFGNFCCNVMQPKFEAATEGRMSRAEVLKSCTREHWRWYVEKSEKVAFDRRF